MEAQAAHGLDISSVAGNVTAPALTGAPALPRLDRRPRTARDSDRRRLLAIADGSAYLLALLVPILSTTGNPGDGVLAALVLTTPVWLLMCKFSSLYDRDTTVVRQSTLDEAPRLFKTAALSTLALMLAAPLFGSLEFGSVQAIIFGSMLTVLLPALRVAARAGVAAFHPPERVLLVGSGLVADIIASKFERHRGLGVDIVGFVDDLSEDSPVTAHNVPCMGGLDDVATACEGLGVERIVVAFSSTSHDDLLELIRWARNSQIKVSIVPRLFDAFGQGVELDHVEGITLLGVHPLTRPRSSLAVKRAIDVVGAAAGIVLLAPLFAGIALVVKLTSPGPVLFRQQRIGRGNRPFQMLKFRTMVDGADRMKSSLAHLNETGGVLFKIADDPRITKPGRFLRRASLDELPQLINVLRGEMSLVGPRPLVPDEDGQVIGFHRARLDLTPGLTGPWQVLGRTAIPFDEMARLDLVYISEWSIWGDIKLLLRTVSVVFGRHGA